MKIVVNGEERELPEGSKVAAALAALCVPREHVAVEHNGEILGEHDLDAITLAPGDVLEVVRFVGGG